MGEASTATSAAEAVPPAEGEAAKAPQFTSGVEIVQGEGKENSGLTAAEWTSMEQMDVQTKNTHTNLAKWL